MQYPLVSILIPAYNHERFVEQALDSVREDTYPNKELIIIDDGSKDGTNIKITNWIQNNRAEIMATFVSRENRGICVTLNELVTLSKGKYVMILASDDYLINNTIRERVELLEQYPDKYVLFSDARVVDEKNKRLAESSILEFHSGDKARYYDENEIIIATIERPVFSGAIAMIRKKIYKEIGMYPKNLFVEDWYFWQRAACKRRVMFYDRIVSCYRRHGTNISNKQSRYSSHIRYGIIKTYILNFYLFRGIKFKTRVLRQIILRSLGSLLYRIRRSCEILTG